MENNKQDHTLTNFNTIVIEKDKLLKALEKNRERHNSIYEAAVSGYWIEAQKILEKKQEDFDSALIRVQKQFDNKIEELQTDINDKNKDRVGQNIYVAFSYDYTWPLKYPENHLEDYDRVIEMLKFSVADKVQLSSTEFDSYVRNNWAWKKNFILNNSNYAYTTYSGCSSPLIYASGCAGISTGAFYNTLYSSF